LVFLALDHCCQSINIRDQIARLAVGAAGDRGPHEPDQQRRSVVLRLRGGAAAPPAGAPSAD
jgi:hypothetical protein